MLNSNYTNPYYHALNSPEKKKPSAAASVAAAGHPQQQQQQFRYMEHDPSLVSNFSGLTVATPPRVQGMNYRKPATKRAGGGAPGAGLPFANSSDTLRESASNISLASSAASASTGMPFHHHHHSIPHHHHHQQQQQQHNLAQVPKYAHDSTPMLPPILLGLNKPSSAASTSSSGTLYAGQPAEQMQHHHHVSQYLKSSNNANNNSSWGAGGLVKNAPPATANNNIPTPSVASSSPGEYDWRSSVPSSTASSPYSGYDDLYAAEMRHQGKVPAKVKRVVNPPVPEKNYLTPDGRFICSYFFFDYSRSSLLNPNNI